MPMTDTQYHDTHYDYPGYFNYESFCDLKVATIPPGHTLVIFTEVEENVGTSVTNRSEVLATQVCQEFGLLPEKTLFVEHYPERGPRIKRLPETYALVEYTWEQGHARKPEWRYLSLENASTLLTRFGW